MVCCSGPWQVMLKQADSSYACIAESATRFTLGEAKEELLRVLGLQEGEESSLEFLRRGYKLAVRKCPECRQPLPESYSPPADEPWTTGIFGCTEDRESCKKCSPFLIALRDIKQHDITQSMHGLLVDWFVEICIM
ncbi:uncharacterized protein LOC130956135 [Arachis stenosperma]|uniref:uncharacterized protein LOC130956135 n=1 Tax=Arachis stenosperma TaxID=217475 RepID=UPI0025ABF846|nr:uncharacterized protein LOC130956135 [Arachis stenosperma]XP_057739153.1 uncharacterized protein LOC130956135 [Arachis stenosperma]XP_057739154.1 uncharacterized protein LOC130956135 [Arachis stenosperma]